MLQDILTSLPLLRLANLASDDGNGPCLRWDETAITAAWQEPRTREGQTRMDKGIGKQDHR